MCLSLWCPYIGGSNPEDRASLIYNFSLFTIDKNIKKLLRICSYGRYTYCSLITTQRIFFSKRTAFTSKKLV